MAGFVYGARLRTNRLPLCYHERVDKRGQTESAFAGFSDV